MLVAHGTEYGGSVLRTPEYRYSSTPNFQELVLQYSSSTPIFPKSILQYSVFPKVGTPVLQYYSKFPKINTPALPFFQNRYSSTPIFAKIVLLSARSANFFRDAVL